MQRFHMMIPAPNMTNTHKIFLTVLTICTAFMTLVMLILYGRHLSIIYAGLVAMSCWPAETNQCINMSEHCRDIAPTGLCNDAV